jgi:lipid-binding SYLF domain-containing protein
VDGATLRPDHGSNRKLYGFEPKVRDLLQGAVTAPEAAARFLGVLNDQSPRKRLQEASSAGE